MSNSIKGCVTFRGELAKKLMKSLKVGKDATFTITAKVTELSERDGLQYVVGPGRKQKEKASPDYTVSADIMNVVDK